MSLNFQPYDDRAGEQTRARWSQGLDGIYNAYFEAKARAQQAQTAGLQRQVLGQQIAANDRNATLQNVTETAQFGAPLQSFAPQEIQTAAMGGQQPLVYSPEKLSVLDRLRGGLEKLQGKGDLSQELTRAQIDKSKAEAEGLRAKASGAGGLEPDKRAQIEGQIMDDYMKSPTYANLAAAKSGLRDLASVQANKSGAADVAAIYSFIKTMDNNAVKEGEIALAQSALPGLDRIKVIYDNMKAGNKLTPAMKKELLEVGRGMYESKRKSADEFRNPFVSRAKQYGINPDIAVPSLSIPDDEMRTMFGGGNDPASIIKQMSSQGKSRDEIKAALKAAGH